MYNTIEQKKSTNTVQSLIGHKNFVIYHVTEEDEGAYQCHVVDGLNNTNHASIYLTVFRKSVKSVILNKCKIGFYELSVCFKIIYLLFVFIKI